MGVQPDQRRPRGGFIKHGEPGKQLRFRGVRQPVHLYDAVGGQTNPGIEQRAATTDHHLTASWVQRSHLSIAVTVQLENVRSKNEMPRRVLWIDGAQLARSTAFLNSAFVSS
jgi:hypothetical protein